MRVKIPKQQKIVLTLAAVVAAPMGFLAAQDRAQRQDEGDGQGIHGKQLSAYEATPLPVVEKMLELAQVRPNEVVYDLGSGDGRVLIMAVQKFGARAVGIELDPQLYEASRAKIWDLGLRDRVQLVQGDVLEQDLSPADVLTIYMTPYAMWKLQPHLEKFLHKGMRIVTVFDQVPGWEPTATVKVPGDNERTYILHSYLISRSSSGASFSKFGRKQ